ncbi:MAG: tripartite tricarboxylate transporter TctB family protein [Bacillota bacterium]|nr:tripartite tricarboxylate transporter TctB family protein [Bacillota bacterium]
MSVDSVLGLVASVGGLLLIWQGWVLGYWVHLSGPGPGFFPVVLGLLLQPVAALLVVGGRSVKEGSEWDRGRLGAIGAGALAFAVTIWLVSWLGMLVAVGLYTLGWLRLVGRYPWPRVVAIAAGTVVAVYLIFVLWLRVPFPTGILPL